jgi:gas vesicle protein
MNLKNNIPGFLTGFATGTLVGVLFTSRKGVVARNKISRKVSDLAKKMRARYESLLTEIVQYFDTIKESRTNIYLHPDKKKRAPLS